MLKLIQQKNIALRLYCMARIKIVQLPLTNIVILNKPQLKNLYRFLKRKIYKLYLKLTMYLIIIYKFLSLIGPEDNFH